MKRPSTQFYFGDWQSNANLKRCSFAEKGMWVDIMALFHDAQEYGFLRWSLKEIANAIGARVDQLQSLVDKGVLKGGDAGQPVEDFVYTPRSGRMWGEPVTLIQKQTGPLWYSSRMVRDEYVRKTKGASTRFKPGQDTDSQKNLFENVIVNNKNNPPLNQDIPMTKPSPCQRQGGGEGDGSSSSSSSSSSLSKEESKKEGCIVAPAVYPPDSFRKIYDLGCKIFPQLTAKNTSSIHQWLKSGADTDLDIIPEIERHQGFDVMSWGFFTRTIANAKATRLTPMPEGRVGGNKSPRRHLPTFAEMRQQKNAEIIEEGKKKYAAAKEAEPK